VPELCHACEQRFSLYWNEMILAAVKNSTLF
jgi:hypothetical protein